MKKTILLTLAVAMLVSLPLSSALAVEVFEASTEMRQYNEDLAYNGYTLFCQFQDDTQYLIDMEGNVVHSWECETTPGLYGYFLNDGDATLLRGSSYSAANDSGIRGGGGASGVQEIDWDGNITFDWEWYGTGYRRHHDFRKIWNNVLGQYTYISLEWVDKTPDDAIALGANTDYSSEFASGWSPCGIVEVNSNQEVIWRWSFMDHCVQDFDPTKNVAFTDSDGMLRGAPVYGDPADHPEKIDTNAPTRNFASHVPVSDWQHCNSLDYNADLGQIAVNAKRFSEFFVIDHDGTFVAGDPTTSIANARGSGGDFMYRWGNPYMYTRDPEDSASYNDEGHQQMYGEHDIQWIGGANAAWDASELPGGGNFLVFDNGCWCPTGLHSEVIEINPYLSDNGEGEVVDTGAYVWPHLAGYGNAPGADTGGGGMMGPPGGGSSSLSNQVEWFFKSNTQSSFYAMHISGATRMPNGNTVICSGTSGHFFEVTADKEVVWEYQCPITGDDTYVTSQTDSQNMSVFRCHRYSPDFAGFIGKDLTPMGTITGRIGGTEEYPEPATYNGIGFGGGLTVSSGGYK